MANIIEIANSAYEERDKAQERIALLMKQAERERMSELSTQKQSSEDQKSISEIEVQKQSMEKIVTEENVKNKSTTLQTQMLQDLKNVNQEKVLSYEEAFAKIEEATGISDID
jgi:hypothetical protein